MNTDDTTRTMGPTASTAPKRPLSYDGVLAHTTVETVHLGHPEGGVVVTEVHTVVNVATDPELRDHALAGSLHRLGDGLGTLAVPFVFHDPDAHKFALVLPEALRHHEMSEHAALLGKLAMDTEHAVPAYVRDAPVVMGAAGLRAYLENLTSSGVSLATLEAEMNLREDAARHREEALARQLAELERRVDDMARREQALRQREQDLAQTAADLALREEALELRFALLQEKEIAAAVHGGGSPSGAVARARSDAPEPSGSFVVNEHELDAVEELAADDVDDDSQDDDDDVMEAATTSRPPAYTPPSNAPVVDDDEVDELEEATGVTAADDDFDEDAALDALTEDVPDGALHDESSAGTSPAGVLDAPEGFLESLDSELAVVLNHDEVHLFVRLSEGKDHVFDDVAEAADLLVQLMDVQGYPVVILALVQRGERRPYVRRSALDPYQPRDLAVLSALERRFAAKAVIYTSEGVPVRSMDIEASRSLNVAKVLQKIESMPRPGETDVPAALERALAAPPPAGSTGHPFVAPDAAPTPQELVKALPLLEKWVTPEQRERAVLVLSVPFDDVEAVFESRLRHAVAVGLALPRGLEAEALARDLADNATDLVDMSVVNFTRSSERDDSLSRTAVANNWEALLTRASDVGAKVADVTYLVAWDAIREVRGTKEQQAVLSSVQEKTVPTLGTPDLKVLLHHPRLRARAVAELCNRTDDVDVPAVCEALFKLPGDDVLAVAPKLLAFGEQAGDGLIDALESDKAHVRHAAALALGQLKLRRAIVPLVQLLSSEPTDAWREIARVLGTFGNGAYRTLSRSFRDPKGQQGRFAYALAHLANNGCDGEVTKLATGDDDAASAMAREALSLRETAQRDQAEVTGATALDPAAHERAFSRNFLQGISKH